MLPDYLMQTWRKWRNESGTTCPGFGVLTLHEEPPVGGLSIQKYSHVVDKNETVLLGYRPDAFAAEVQSAKMLAINGHMPVRPGQTGQCTTTFPANVSVDKALIAHLRPGMTCGVEADSWLASPLGNCFDIAHDFQGGLDNVISVYPAQSCQNVAVAILGADVAVTPGDKLLVTPAFYSGVGALPAQFYPPIEIVGGNVVSKRSALFCGEVTATFRYAGGGSAPTYVTSISINAKRGAEATTPFFGAETIHGDNSSASGFAQRVHTLSISVPFSLRLRAGDAIIPRYTGDVDVAATHAYMTIRHGNTAIPQRRRTLP